MLRTTERGIRHFLHTCRTVRSWHDRSMGCAGREVCGKEGWEQNSEKGLAIPAKESGLYLYARGAKKRLDR